MPQRVYQAESAGAALILAHGAGAGQSSAFMMRVARGLAARGVTAITFDFPYMAAGRKVPDQPAVLERAWREAIDEARRGAAVSALPVFIGGKSMGGRIASQVAAQGIGGIAGLVFLGYPLHPPGKPAARRDAHLPSIREPMLFVQGTRDAFGSADEIRELLPRLGAPAVVHAIAEGDHSYKVPARAGRRQDDVHEEVIETVAGWIRRSTARTSDSE